MCIKAFTFLFLIIILGIALGTQQYLVFLLLILFFNITTLFSLGPKAIGAMVFPYSVNYIKIQMDVNDSNRYAFEFSNLIDKLYLMIRNEYHMNCKGKENDKNKRFSSVKTGTMLPGVNNKDYFVNIKYQTSNIDFIIKSRGILDLLSTYVKTNNAVAQKAKEEGRSMSLQIHQITKVIQGLISRFSVMQLQAINQKGEK